MSCTFITVYIQVTCTVHANVQLIKLNDNKPKYIMYEYM